MKNRKEYYELNKLKRAKRITLKDISVIEPLIESVVIKTKDKEYRNKSVLEAMKDIAKTHNYRIEK